jgi:hypothetical protein
LIRRVLICRLSHVANVNVEGSTPFTRFFTSPGLAALGRKDFLEYSFRTGLCR